MIFSTLFYEASINPIPKPDKDLSYRKATDQYSYEQTQKSLTKYYQTEANNVHLIGCDRQPFNFMVFPPQKPQPQYNYEKSIR